jgi:hypothetical protein
MIRFEFTDVSDTTISMRSSAWWWAAFALSSAHERRLRCSSEPITKRAAGDAVDYVLEQFAHELAPRAPEQLLHRLHADYDRDPRLPFLHGQARRYRGRGRCAYGRGQHQTANGAAAMSDERITLDIAAIAEELNDEFKQRYAEDQDFRKRFDAYLRKLGIPVMPDGHSAR